MAAISASPAQPTDRRALVARAVAAGAAGLLAVMALQIGTGVGGERATSLLGDVAYDLVIALCALCCFLYRGGSRTERVAWASFGSALVVWGLGDLYYTVAFHSTPEDAIPFPSPADAGYLAFYVPAFVGLGLLVRSQVVRIGRTLWLDGLVAGLTVGAAAAALVVRPVLETTGGDLATVATNLAYPLADAVLLAVVIGALALARWRPGPPWVLISLGIGLFALSDAVYLVRVAEETYVYGTLLDLGWLAGMVLIALASLLPPSRVAAGPGDVRFVWAVPAVFALADVALLVYDHYVPVPAVVLWLASLSLVAVVARMALTAGENARLLGESRREARSDALTGLGNRRALIADLTRLLEAPAGTPSVLLLSDLDGFKNYNDTYGHPAGDALLARLGARLHESVRGRGIAYRLGGDEFCVLARGGRNDMPLLRSLTMEALSEDGEGFSIRASSGGVVVPDEALEASEALRVADVRMYEEKAMRPAAGLQTLDVLLSALQARDPSLADHTSQVTRLAVALAELLGVAAEEVERIRLAAQLHDIGKLGVPDSILAKSGSLDEAEWAYIRSHTLIGERIVSAAPALRSVAPLIRASHERWDGTGYPDGLAGEDIPLGSRIVAVADAYDAMRSDRPYCGGLGHAAALAELRREAGAHFDPRVVERFPDAYSALAVGPASLSVPRRAVA